MVHSILSTMFNINLINFRDFSLLKVNSNYKTKAEIKKMIIIICQSNNIIQVKNQNKKMNVHLDLVLKKVSKKVEKIILVWKLEWWIHLKKLHKQWKDKIVLKFLINKMLRIKKKLLGLYSPKTRNNLFKKIKNKLFILQLLNKFDHILFTAFVYLSINLFIFFYSSYLCTIKLPNYFIMTFLFWLFYSSFFLKLLNYLWRILFIIYFFFIFSSEK